MPQHTMQAKIDALHAAACERGDETYIDPGTGYMVFTALSLEGNNRCCGCACRHCPYGHALVPEPQREGLLTDPWYDEGDDYTQTPTDVLFWSGGKDSLHSSSNYFSAC